jgi:hypothetical protein
MPGSTPRQIILTLDPAGAWRKDTTFIVNGKIFFKRKRSYQQSFYHIFSVLSTNWLFTHTKAVRMRQVAIEIFTPSRPFFRELTEQPSSLLGSKSLHTTTKLYYAKNIRLYLFF